MYSGVLFRQRLFWVVGSREMRQIGEKSGPGTASGTVSTAIPGTAAVSRVSQHAWIGTHTPSPVPPHLPACPVLHDLPLEKGRVDPGATPATTVRCHPGIVARSPEHFNLLPTTTTARDRATSPHDSSVSPRLVGPLADHWGPLADHWPIRFFAHHPQGAWR